MDTVAKLTREEQRKWPRYLSAAVLAFNANTSAATGLAPYECVFGRPAPLPTALRYSTVSDAASSSAGRVPRDTLQYLTGLQRTLNHLEQQLHTASVSSHDKNKLRHDERIVEHIYEPGDRVWLKQNAVKGGESKKLSSRWSGPYRIVAKRRNWTYVIAREGEATETTAHHNRLKPCHSNPASSHTPKQGHPTRIWRRSRSPVNQRNQPVSQAPFHPTCSSRASQPGNGAPPLQGSCSPGQTVPLNTLGRSRPLPPGVVQTRSGRAIRPPVRYGT